MPYSGTAYERWSLGKLMNAVLKSLASKALLRMGYRIQRADSPLAASSPPSPQPVAEIPYAGPSAGPSAGPPSHSTELLEDDDEYGPVIKKVREFTMTSHARIAALVDATRHVVRAEIPGAIAECGVWRGGSIMAAALTLLEEGQIRDLYLFDTFAGMTAPTEHDVDVEGLIARQLYDSWKIGEYEDKEWCCASLSDVRANVLSTGYPEDRIHFVEGDVLKTIPHAGLEEIAILRLDTDWYESTRHELAHLYPRLRAGGILIIDDFGYWKGCRKAVLEYFGDSGPFLSIIDRTARLAVKPSAHALGPTTTEFGRNVAESIE